MQNTAYTTLITVDQLKTLQRTDPPNSIGSGLSISHSSKNSDMSRPLRLEFAVALHHVTSRGDRREDSYHDDADRQAWLSVLAQVCASLLQLCDPIELVNAASRAGDWAYTLQSTLGGRQWTGSV